jgi:hypothetical protein
MELEKIVSVRMQHWWIGALMMKMQMKIVEGKKRMTESRCGRRTARGCHQVVAPKRKR